LAQPAQPTEKKVSHSAGWIALAAFLFANFTPAILAPILVLVALILRHMIATEGRFVFRAAKLCVPLELRNDVA
jgi:ABC-type uncharacterized transport system permease subunit